MTSTSSRILTLLSLLQSRRNWTGAELADRLDVSGRTIRKDIERLRSLGYPVESTRGRAGSYRLGAGANMPPLLLDDEEAVAIAVSLTVASAHGISSVQEAAPRATAKLEQVLPVRLRRRIAAIRTFTENVPNFQEEPDTDVHVLQLVASACRDREKQRITYESHTGVRSRRIVEPHRVVNWGRRWYLVAWDDDRSDWRTFRIDRIEKTEPTSVHFQDREPPDADITSYIARNVSRSGWRYRARFTVSASAGQVLEHIDPTVGSVEPIDDTTCILESGADDLWTIAVYIGILGFDFTVDSPPELVELLRTIAERYQRAIGEQPTERASR